MLNEPVSKTWGGVCQHHIDHISMSSQRQMSTVEAVSLKDPTVGHCANAIALIGDSTLDNIVWVQDPQHCISFTLKKLLKDFTVVNLAADGFTTDEVLNGGLLGRRVFISMC